MPAKDVIVCQVFFFFRYAISFTLKITSKACSSYPHSTNQKSTWKTSFPLRLLASPTCLKASPSQNPPVLESVPGSPGWTIPLIPGCSQGIASWFCSGTFSIRVCVCLVHLFVCVSISRVTLCLAHASSYSWDKQKSILSCFPF